MMKFRWMIAVLVMVGVTAFSPISSKNEVSMVRKAALVSEVVQVATIAGATGVIFFADKSGATIAPASSKPATAAPETTTASAGVDISVPYDAAAKLAYDASPKNMDFESFKTKYKEETVAMIKSKQK
jgi:hypothetical protein